MREALAERYLNGAVNRREKTEYGYSTTGYRVSAASYVDESGHGTFALANRVEFLADEHSLTSYAQTLRETHFDGAGQLSKTIDYSYGSDELTQTTRTYDAPGVITSEETLTFGHDAHGSVRLLTNLLGAVEQLFLYDAYGADLAIFNTASGTLARVATADAKTAYRHDGEYFERETGAKYLRDRRHFDGRFSTLDRYSGDDYSPLSLHKYLFTGGDPANGIDPSGLFTITQQMAVTAIRGVLTNMALGAVQGFVTSPAISFLFGERNANRLWADAVEGAKVGAVAGGISFGVGGALAPVGKVLVATYGRTAIRTLGPAVTRYLFTGVMSGANGAITGAAVGGINAWWEDGEAQEIAFAALEGGFVGSVMGLGAGLGSAAWRRYSYSRAVAANLRSILRGTQLGAEKLRKRASTLFEERGASGDTVAVIRGRNRVTGKTRTFVSLQGKQQTPPKKWTLEQGEEWVAGTGNTVHAEENILNNPRLAEWDFIEGGTSRNVCSATERCGEAIEKAGMRLGGESYAGRQDTDFRTFWRAEQ